MKDHAKFLLKLSDYVAWISLYFLLCGIGLAATGLEEEAIIFKDLFTAGIRTWLITWIASLVIRCINFLSHG